MRQKLIMFVIFMMVFAISNSKAQIVINEILASNTSTNLDEQNKQFVDWIELYNPSDKEINITKWYLSDNIQNPTKWEIPFYTSIAPKGFKLFWADDTNTSNHTNFKLDIEGESIYLFNKDLVLVDSITYPLQSSDISYGRVAGKMNQWMYFHEVTPLKENSLLGMKSVIFSDDPMFSKKAGFYEEALNIELSASSATDKIYYTLNGSTPTQASYQYSSPIEINKNTTIRARTYSENKIPSKVMTQTYFIKESFSLPVVSLTIDSSYLWDENMGIYVEGKNYIPNKWKTANYFQEWERPVNVEYFDTNGELGFNMNAGVRIHGRSTRNHAQKTLAIFSREKYGTPSIPYKLYGTKSPEVIQSFLLRNGGNEWGVTMFLDALNHTLVIDKIDIDAQLYQPAIVFLNGRYWGIHNIREKINEHYIISKHTNVSSDIDVIESDIDVSEVDNIITGEMKACYGTIDEYNKMIKFIENNELSIKENYDTIKKWIDIDELINYLATQVYIGNKDWPSSNMKFWKNRDESGKWRWILYDTELSFTKGNKFVSFDMLEHMLAKNADYYATLPWSNYLFRKLFENDEFKFEFIQRVAVYLNTVFESDHVLHIIDSLKTNIEPEVERSLNKWGGLQQNAVPYYITSKNQTTWEVNVEYIRNFVRNRPGILRQSIINYFNLKGTVNLELKVNDRNAGNISLMGYTLAGGDFKGSVFTDIPIRLEAIPNSGYEFEKWKGVDDEKNGVIYLQKDKKITAIFRKTE